MHVKSRLNRMLQGLHPNKGDQWPISLDAHLIKPYIAEGTPANITL